MSQKTINYQRSLALLEPSKQFLKDERDVLYGLLYRIEDRGWRSHLCTNEIGVSTCRIVVEGCDFWSDWELYSDPSDQKDSRAEVVLYAYVKALAAQRQVADGSGWRHFKGDHVDVVCEAFRTSSISGGYEPHGGWVVEEEPQKEAQLWLQDGVWSYTCERAILSGNRVFYTHDSKAFARLADDFLGVAGPKYPEMEGCLRFVEVAK